MKRHIKSILLFLGVAAVLAATVALWRRIPREPQLLERSQRIASTTDWRVERSRNPMDPGDTYYFWLNQTELLHFRNTVDASQGFRLRLDGSHSDTEISGLQIPQNPSTPLEVSSDGRLLLWLKSGPSRSYIYPRVSILDRSPDRVSTTPPAPLPITGSSPHPRFHVVTTEAGDHYQILAGSEGKQAYHGTAGMRFVITEEPDAFQRVSPQGRVSGSEPTPGKSEATNEFRVNYTIHRLKKPMVEHTIHIAKDKAVENVCVSPDGNRIFFEERFDAKDPMPEWVYERIPLLRPHDLKEKCVFVIADIKTGKRKELVTYETFVSANSSTLLPYVHDVKWAPDGKRLSYIYRESLYTIPAD